MGSNTKNINVDLGGLMSTSKLPGDVMIEILSRLPIKSLLKFASVSKAWSALINNQSFIHLHFQQSPPHYLITRPNKSTNLTDTFLLSYYDNQLDLNAGLFHPGLVGVVGSSHGLICTTPNDSLMSGNSYIIYNPALHHFKQIFMYPKHQLIPRKSHFISSGFGYDSTLRDYKIVRLEQYNLNDNILTFCHVYSNHSDSWSTIHTPHLNGTLVERLSKANVNGTLHWLAKTNHPPPSRAYILSFNIREQVFGEIMLPKMGPQKYFHLHVWKQCLALIYYLMEPTENKRIEIWWMEVYGSRRSWAKERVIGPNTGFYLMLASSENGQFIFINENTENVYLYDHITNEAKHVALQTVMPGNYNKEVQVVNYKESLIPVNKHGKFEMKLNCKCNPWLMNWTWKQQLSMLFFMCCWFCSWMV